MKQHFWVVTLALSLAASAWADRSPAVEEDLSGDCSGMIGTDVYNFCLRAATINAFNAEGNIDCIECLLYADTKTTETNPWLEALGVLAGPLASFGSNWVWAESTKKSNQHYAEAIRKSNIAWAESYRDTNEYWAKAYTAGYEACQNNFNSYLAYTVDMAADPVTAEQAEVLAQCNGQDLSLYAGYQGMYGMGGGTGINPYQAAGYTNQLLAGLIGPYGLNGINGGVGINPYLNLGGANLTISNPLLDLINSGGGVYFNAGISAGIDTGLGLNGTGINLTTGTNLLNTGIDLTTGTNLLNTGINLNGNLLNGGLGAQIVGYDASGNPIYNTGLNTTLNYGLGNSALNAANGLATTNLVNANLLGTNTLALGVNGTTALNERAIINQQDAQVASNVLANQGLGLYQAGLTNNYSLNNMQYLTGANLLAGGTNTLQLGIGI